MIFHSVDFQLIKVHTPKKVYNHTHRRVLNFFTLPSRELKNDEKIATNIRTCEDFQS